MYNKTRLIIAFAFLCIFASVVEANVQFGDIKVDLLKPIPEKLVVLTFDDACASQATFVAPLLKKYGFGATFYVCEFGKSFGNKKYYMSWEQMRTLHEMGFEIGNHTLSHPGLRGKPLDYCQKQLKAIEDRCAANKISKPTTFCWPGYSLNKPFYSVLAENGYTFARGGGQRAYNPMKDNPFNTPSFDVKDRTLKDKDYFANAAKQARAGQVVIFTFHGVPDLEHNWVNTDPARFEECMKYLKDNNYTVIAMRDLAEYIDVNKTVESKNRDDSPAAKLGLAANDLEKVFRDPPDSAKPWVFWYWMRANVSKEGITRDLQDMAAAGIGGAMLFSIGNLGSQTLADPPANPLSDYWWQLVVHAAKEADRLGLKIAMNACDGWALAGGPWITPQLSMQELVMTEKIVEGPGEFKGKLAQPTTRRDYYRDVAVLAYPGVEGTGITSTQLKPKATTNIKGLDPQVLVSGAPKLVNFSTEGWIQYEFDKPFTCRSITIWPDIKTVYQLNRAELLVSDDGKKFRSLGRLKPSKFHGWQDRGLCATHSIEPARAKFFRFVIDKSGTQPHSENHEGSKARNRNRLAAQRIELSSQPRINQYQGKAGYRWRRSAWTTQKQCPDELCVPFEKIINITKKMSTDGTINWKVPKGRWVIQRIGYTTTDETNNPAGSGRGLECDKFNPAAAKIQFDGWFGQALDRVGPKLAGKTIRRNHTDSWEAFSQNFSPVFIDEFKKRRGYDPTLWLPAYSGVPIQSAELTERFLYDVRRTIADLVCDNFYAPLVKEGRKRNTVFSAECIAPTMMADGLQHFKYTDMPMGEFWLNSVNQDKPNDVMDAICGGHIYGKHIIGAEAFTQNPIRWNEDPYYLKPMGDYNFARGINQFVLHVWAHQAFEKKPGVTLSHVGTFFSGTQTWHKPGKAWFEYISRCSAMLQQGLPVADVCYFIGEEQPARSYLRHDLPVELPAGYKYDCINRDALLTRAKAKNGRMVLPDGVSYRLLVLPQSKRMTPEVAEKIGELAKAGVPVIGSPPNRSISLSGYPDCDKKVQSIVSNSWKQVHANPKVMVSQFLGLPDLYCSAVSVKPVYIEKMQYHSEPLAWNHRRTKDADIYFISNQQRKSLNNVEVSIRVTGKVPELWDPVTGEITDAGVWRQEDRRTYVSISLSPAGSVFVVFRRKTPDDLDQIVNAYPLVAKAVANTSWLSVESDRAVALRNGMWRMYRKSGKKIDIDVTDLPAEKTINSPWTVTFPPNLGAPGKIQMPKLHSLSEHKDFGVKHFSGTAQYSSTFNVDKINKDHRIFLDLGTVFNLAEVTVNGKILGVLWKPPFTIEVTDVVKTGKNTLNITVTNTWKNRLIGDSSLPKSKRITWTWAKEKWFAPDEPLEPSGLAGPVVLKTAREVILK